MWREVDKKFIFIRFLIFSTLKNYRSVIFGIAISLGKQVHLACVTDLNNKSNSF